MQQVLVVRDERFARPLGTVSLIRESQTDQGDSFSFA